MGKKHSPPVPVKPERFPSLNSERGDFKTVKTVLKSG